MYDRTHTLLVVVPLFALLACCRLTSDSRADTIMLGASKDSTLINHSAGSVSNGTGTLIAGQTFARGPGAIRALLAFDVAASIPQGSTITGAELTLTVLQAGAGSDNDSYALHPLEQDWGEGTSFATTGQGAPSTTGDVTWIHPFFNNSFWTNPGGDFRALSSATEKVGDSGPVTWQSTSGLVADVQAWLDDPHSDFGWILIGAESRFGSARQFASRESNSNTPLLTITFTSVPEPSSLLLLGLATIFTPYRRRQFGW